MIGLGEGFGGVHSLCFEVRSSKCQNFSGLQFKKDISLKLYLFLIEVLRGFEGGVWRSELRGVRGEPCQNFRLALSWVGMATGSGVGGCAFGP